ncbi:MAG: TrkA family potassium uptake protein [Eubacterium aggregans]|uniref:Trk system potassium uptake protein TrkA n=1 Tax=Eubacterium aggregans TaxID=81409 RepID=A0A1H4EDG8_9FIRM|nr:TrkA family potassium uptake protein [Eubacterium aggregans]MDD4690862.1 TrkA family potassium uptake protein [Eubacterium aggregans]MEA5074360.1 TrkA family potassium uptake protein [Eubacterium aggregans]SEA82322.1 trk system potassium uptake protein TrkA [Eubacterium aggregans]
MRDKQFAILGLGRFGEALAITLSELGSNVVVVDRDEEKVQNIANYVTYAVQADVSDINALKSIGLKNVDVVIVSITSDINSSIMGVVNAQELGIPEIYGKANNAQHEKVLLKLGVKKVFSPERDMGERVAHNLFSGDFIDVLELDTDNSIVEIDSLHTWENKALESLDMRTRYGLNVIAIRSQDHLNVSPVATDIIVPGDKLVVIGDNASINEVTRLAQSGR